MSHLVVACSLRSPPSPRPFLSSSFFRSSVEKIKTSLFSTYYFSDSLGHFGISESPQCYPVSLMPASRSLPSPVGFLPRFFLGGPIFFSLLCTGAFRSLRLRFHFLSLLCRKTIYSRLFFSPNSLLLPHLIRGPLFPVKRDVVFFLVRHLRYVY